MSRKLIVKDFKAISAGDMSTDSIIGTQTVVNQHDTVVYNFTWSGGQTVNGNIGIDASLDGSTWFPLDFGTTIVTSAVSGLHQLFIQTVGFNYTRPTYTRTNGSASGTLNVELFCSNLGN